MPCCLQRVSCACHERGARRDESNRPDLWMLDSNFNANEMAARIDGPIVEG